MKNGILTGWLYAYGWIQKSSHFQEYVPTESGKEIGIIAKNFIRNNFNHTICIYTEQAQQYIFDHINDIIEFNLSEN